MVKENRIAELEVENRRVAMENGELRRENVQVRQNWEVLRHN